MGGDMSTMSEETKRQLSIEDQQQAILFQFVALYERWSEDRQVAAKQGYDLAKQLEQFTKEVSRFSSIEEAVIVKLKKSLNETTVTLSEQVNTATTDALNKTLESSMKRMDMAAKSVEAILAEYQEIKWLRYMKMLAVNVACSLVVSGFVVWLFMPQPTLPLTESDMNTYLAGKKFSLIWSTLSKEKQQRIVSIVKDKEQEKQATSNRHKNKKTLHKRVASF
jgi:hypothetical protein